MWERERFSLYDWFHGLSGGAGRAPEALGQLLAYFLPLRIVIILLAPLMLRATRLPARYPTVLWATLGLALVSLPLSYLLERRGLLQERGWRWALPISDLILVTLLHWGSQGVCSPLFPFYYEPIAYAGVLAGYGGGLLMALGAAGCYGLLYLLSQTSVALPLPEGWIVLVVLLLFPMAGAVSGYLGRRFRDLEEMRHQLLRQAQALRQEAEERRRIYERWYRAVDRLKADFVYSASHELRTPLTPVKGYLQMFLSPSFQLPPEKMREYMEIMSKNVNLLAQLVDDIIYLQRVTRIPIDLEEVSVRQILCEALEEVGPEAEEAGVHIELEDGGGPAPILGGRDSLKLALTNLLESLVRDSPPESTISLELASTNKGVQIRLFGSGLAIPVEQQERIFDLFFHADSSPTYVLGREGLRLSIARYIVEMHGGYISVTNRVRGGLAFTLHLPGRPGG